MDEEEYEFNRYFKRKELINCFGVLNNSYGVQAYYYGERFEPRINKIFYFYGKKLN